MHNINWARVYLGGMAAGAFAVAVEAMAFILGAYDRLGDATGVSVQSITLATHLTVAAMQIFLGGPVAVALYAAIRPRFGPGPRTAVYAALFVWFLLGPYGLGVLALGGFVKLPLGLYVVLSVSSLVHVTLSMLVGCSLYQEESPTGQTARAASA